MCGHPDLEECKFGVGPDNLRETDKRERLIFEENNFCESCRKVEVPDFFGTGQSKTVVDCRSAVVVARQKRNGIDQS